MIDIAGNPTTTLQSSFSPRRRAKARVNHLPNMLNCSRRVSLLSGIALVFAVNLLTMLYLEGRGREVGPNLTAHFAVDEAPVVSGGEGTSSRENRNRHHLLASVSKMKNRSHISFVTPNYASFAPPPPPASPLGSITNATTNRPAPDAEFFVMSNLPDWLTSYMDWHRRVKPTITEENWDQHRYLVLRCLSSSPFCSGTCDRLRNFLFLIYLAQSDQSQQNRIFLIHWSRPAPLEEFFSPPQGGLDWRVPDWLLPNLELGNESHWKDVPWNEDSLLQDYKIKRYYTVVEFSFIWQLHGLIDRYERQYRDSFRALFRPVQPVQDIVDRTQRVLGLQNVPYTSLHLRMKYTSISSNAEQVWSALTCAERVGDPSSPIFVASDSGEMALLATRLAVERNLTRRVVARVEYPSLHIDMGADYLNPRSEDWKSHNASEYYTVFSDLLLLGDSTCVVGGTGSYGKWGSQLSRNASCFANYVTREGC
jgi:hypothetical protein